MFGKFQQKFLYDFEFIVFEGENFELILRHAFTGNSKQLTIIQYLCVAINNLITQASITERH
jgi:hypothetical protein